MTDTTTTDTKPEEMTYEQMTGTELVRVYNAMVRQGLAAGMTGIREINIFHDKPTAVARCRAMASSLRAWATGQHAADEQPVHEQPVHEQPTSGGTQPAEKCTYPRCKCTVHTSTSQPEPLCPKGLDRDVVGGTHNVREHKLHITQVSPGLARLRASPGYEAAKADVSRERTAPAEHSKQQEVRVAKKAKKEKVAKTAKAPKATNGNQRSKARARQQHVT